MNTPLIRYTELDPNRLIRAEMIAAGVIHPMPTNFTSRFANHAGTPVLRLDSRARWVARSSIAGTPRGKTVNMQRNTVPPSWSSETLVIDRTGGIYVER